MKKFIVTSFSLSLLCFSMSSIATAKNYTIKNNSLKDSKRITKLLTYFSSSLTDQILAKSLVNNQLMQIHTVVIDNSGNIWDETGYNCNLSIKVYSHGSVIAQTSESYSDEDCPSF